jgi:deoxyadenosine/deoxycytidine kinase
MGVVMVRYGDMDKDDLLERLSDRMRTIDQEIHRTKMYLQNRDYQSMYKSYNRVLGMINEHSDLAAALLSRTGHEALSSKA